MTPKCSKQDVFMWGLGASSPFLGVEYDTPMLWAAERFENKLAWSQFEILPIFKNVLREGRAVSKCFLLASTINVTTTFFFTFFLRGALSSYPHQKTNLDQRKKEQTGEEMFSELLQISKPLSRRLRVEWTSNLQPWRKREWRRGESRSEAVSHSISKKHLPKIQRTSSPGVNRSRFPPWPKKEVPLPTQHPTLLAGKPGTLLWGHM